MLAAMLTSRIHLEDNEGMLHVRYVVKHRTDQDS